MASSRRKLQDSNVLATGMGAASVAPDPVRCN